MGYTNLQLIQNFLKRELSEDEEALFLTLNRAVEKWIDNKTGSHFGPVEFTTRYFDGGEDVIDIDPAVDIVSVSHLNNEGEVSYPYTLGTEYSVIPSNETIKRSIFKRNGCFPRGDGVIAVRAKFTEYDHGIPEDIQIIATRICAAMLTSIANDGSTGEIKSESIEGHSITYVTSADSITSVADNDPLVKSMLELRRELFIA